MTRDDVPADVVEKERRIAEQITRDEGKPEQAIAKIVEGRLNAYFKDVVLTEQAFVKEQKTAIKQVLAQARRHRHRLRPVPGRPGLTPGQQAATEGLMPESGPAGVLHPSWHRVVLKLSGGLFAGNEPLGISPDVVAHLAAEIIAAVKDGVQVAAVVGGGNMFRGAALAERGIDRARADYMGMLSTVINCLALQDVLEKPASRPGSRPPSRWARWPRPTSRAGPSAPGKGPGGDLRPASARRSSPPTPRPRSGRWRSAPTRCSRAPR